MTKKPYLLSPFLKIGGNTSTYYNFLPNFLGQFHKRCMLSEGEVEKMRSNWHSVCTTEELYLKGGFIAKSTQRSHPHVICAFARSIMIIVLGQNSSPNGP